MKYLHAHDIVHRDLKPENILMDGRLCPKIGDFGFAKRINSNGICISINESTKDAKGTPIYMAPEVFETKESTKASDVYAFGMIAYEIITENIPYKEFDCIQLFLSVQRGRRPPFDKPINDSYRNLIEKCWSQDPAERPTFEKIVEEFINDEGFITKEVNEKDFRSYANFLEEYPSSFDINKIIRPDDYIQIASKTFHEIDVKRYHEQQNKTTFSTFLSRMGISRESLCPKYVLDKLDTKCQRLIFEAEHDEEKQYYIGTYFIESKCEFPLNVSVGVKYLEYSISKGNINSIVYLSEMLMKGILIEKNYEKANAYFSKIYKKDDRIYYLYGKVLKKQKNFKESYKKFKEGSEKLIPECMYELGKLLFCGKGCKKNIQNAFYYFDLSKKEGVHKSELYLAILDELNRFESFFNLSTEDKHFFIKQVIKYNLENDEIINYKKIEMKFNDTENRFIQKSFESTDFVIILKKFDSILIEISNQSKHFESILQQLANIKHNIGLNMMIFVYISKIQKISSEFDQYNVISVIDVGSTVLKIQKSAFKGCSSLTQITIPSSVTSIEEYSFAGCENLTIINFTPNIKSIEKHTFDGCSSLKQISIPYSVTSIGKYAFNNCKSLKEITIPYLVTSIGKHSFAGCENLTEIIITSPINTIEKHTFDGCSSLKKILIPYSVTSIGKYAFNECMSLEQIVIPSVTSIGNNAFYRCSSMTNVCIDPSSTITSIQNSTFELCTSLTEISIPQSVTSISQFAFRSCKKLKEIKINCRINKIESNAFDDCPSLQIIPKSKTYQLKEFLKSFLTSN